METKLSFKRDGENIIYCDIQATNTSNSIQRMSIDISRSTPIISNPSQYYLSIVRFKIPTYKFPLFVFPDPSTRPLIVSMDYNGVTTSSQVIFTQENFEPVYSNTNNYFSYQHFLQNINTAIRTCFTSLSLPAITFPQPPYLIYDSDTELISLIALQSYGDIYPYNTLTIPHIYFNQDLYNYFGNLKCINFGRQNNGLDNKLIIENLINNIKSYPFDPSTPNVLTAGFEMKQEYSTIYLMNSLTNITIVSNNLPTVAENIMDAKFTGNLSSNNQTLKILNDFQPIFDKAGIQRSFQYYQPTAFRYTDIISSSDLFNLNLQFYLFSAETKNYIPLYIDPTFAISIKLMFKRKELNY